MLKQHFLRTKRPKFTIKSKEENRKKLLQSV